MSSNEKMCDCNQGRLPCTCKPQTVEQALSGHWVTCSPEWIKAGGNCATAPRILCGQGQGVSHMHPAHQPHGEPVALPARKPWNGLLPTADNLKGEGYNACLDDVAKLGPLYTHADPAEVERLREENRRLHEAGEFIGGVNQGIEDKLRAQLAERDAECEAFEEEASILRDGLKDVLGWIECSQSTSALRAVVEKALSASAERNQCDGCQAGIPVVNGAHRMGKPGGYADSMACQAAKYAGAEPCAPKFCTCNACYECRERRENSALVDRHEAWLAGVEHGKYEASAPVEIDDRAAFDAWHAATWPNGAPTDGCWLTWQARAALERKP